MTTAHVLDVSPRQLAWLETELARWEGTGILDPGQAHTIRSGYRASNRFSLAKLGLMLGGTFVGVGILWLVAANLDQLSPLGRFLAVVALWIAISVGAELLATRRTHGGASPVVGALRGVAVIAFGAVIMQAAQSMQVPAWEPKLVGLWGLGALIHAYAVRGVVPLVVGAAASTGWVLWQVLETSPSGLTAVLTLGAVAVLAATLAVLHQTFRWPSFASTWRVVSAFLGLGVLFAAAVPEVRIDDFTASFAVIAFPVLAAVLAVAATILARSRRDFEALAALGAGVIAVLLVCWETSTDLDSVGAAEWLHAAVAVIAFVGVATWFAVVGIRRESPGLTYLAIAALVVFTTFQAFAVFAAIIDGAWLFLVLGLVFGVTGYAADRGRRELTAALADPPPGDTSPESGSTESDTSGEA